MNVSFFVPTAPQGKARPRVFRNPHNGTVHGVTPAKTRRYEELIRQCFEAAHVSKIACAPIGVRIVARFAVPRSYTKKQRRDIAEWRLLPTKKPDIDNITKCVLDALNGVAYADDSQVVRVSCEKLYVVDGEDREGLTITLEEVILLTRAQIEEFRQQRKQHYAHGIGVIEDVETYLACESALAAMIRGITHEADRRVMEEMYLRGRSITATAQSLGKSERTVCRLRNRAISRIAFEP